MDAEKLLEFFRNRENIRVLLDAGIDQLHEEGAVMDDAHVLAFFPNGHGSEKIQQLIDEEWKGWVEFNIEHLETILYAAKRFNAETVRVNTNKAFPLFIKTEHGVFAIAPRFRLSSEGDEEACQTCEK